MAQGYSTYATTGHRMAKKYLKDAEYENEPLAMKQLFFVLPDKIIGTNSAFNDGMGSR